jgi:ATP-dependent RNA helicase MSS116
VRFASLPLCAESQRALAEGLRYEHCTKVQAMSLPACLSGVDVVCKAKTGSGKTIAFLLPAIERIRAAGARRPPRTVACLVISPTRELAAQIAAEAAKLAQFHRPPLSVQVVVGGTNVKSEAAKLSARAPDILVATPGRLIDHLRNGALAPALQAPGGLQTLVFDEADQLLDMGFR